MPHSLLLLVPFRCLAGFRGRVITSRQGLWKEGPFKALTEGLSRSGGRNAQGGITMRHRGGGHRKVYRLVAFARPAGMAAGVVQRIEYDPNRSARIALVRHKGADASAALRQQYSYFLAPQDVKEGDVLHSGADAPIRPGNTLPLSAIPVGMAVHNVELRPGAGGQLARSAGTSCTLVKKGEVLAYFELSAYESAASCTVRPVVHAKLSGHPSLFTCHSPFMIPSTCAGDDGYSVVKLPSGEQRLVLSRCMATIGTLSNPQHKNRKLGKAGAARWLGRRPRVRGVAMNPVDHPHGGGRGKSKGRISQTPWGKPTKGYRTRHNPRTDWVIRQSRHKAMRA
jgi:large subunit ribosomal protein L2